MWGKLEEKGQQNGVAQPASHKCRWSLSQKSQRGHRGSHVCTMAASRTHTPSETASAAFHKHHPTPGCKRNAPTCVWGHLGGPGPHTSHALSIAEAQRTLRKKSRGSRIQNRPGASKLNVESSCPTAMRESISFKRISKFRHNVFLLHLLLFQLERNRTM